MSGSSTPTWSKPLAAFRIAQTRQGDSLQRIALRETGDAANWYSLINLNGLQPPYITDDASEAVAGTVLLAGRDTIKVPASGPTPQAVSDPVSVLGTDVSLAGGTLSVGPGGDFATVSEAANLKQALENRLATHPADLLFHPAYGCKLYRLIGKTASPANDQLAAAFLGQAVLADPRVASVQNTTATVTGDTIAASATAVAVDGKLVPVGVPPPGASETS